MLRRFTFVIFAAGLAAVYVAERSLSDMPRWALDGVGALLLALGLGLAVARLASAFRRDDESRRSAATAVGAYVVALAAVGLYAVESALLQGAEHATARTVLMVAWPTLLLLGLAPGLAIELALSSMAQSPVYELWRVRLAGRAARVTVFAIVAFAGVNYAASQRNRKIDLSYFRTTEPSQPTLELVRGLSEPVRLVLFSAPGNDVGEEARTYLEAVAKAGGSLVKLEVVDQALVPDLARELKVRQNGVIAVAKEGHSETLTLGVDMEAARSTLRKLDAEVQERLLKLTRPPRTIYFTSGHNERDWVMAATDKRFGLNDFKALVDSLGFTTKRLGLAEGLGAEVPKDAGIVVIAGPTEPFLPAERDTLRAWLDKGGRLFAFIDPDTGVSEDELLAPLGVKVTKSLIASDKGRVRVTGRGESPYYFATNRFSSHPSVTTDSQNSTRLAVVVLGAGSIEKRDDAPPELRQVFTVHSLADGWDDKNGNGVFDRATEKQVARELAVAIEGTPRAGDAAGGKADRKANARDAAADAKADGKADAKAAEAKGDGKALATGAKGATDTVAKGKADGKGDAAAEVKPAATAPQPLRAIVVSDADAVANGILGNAGNAYLVADGLKWLAGDEQLIGKSTSEEDVAIVHKRDDDAVWFYGTSFAIPALVVAVGVALGRKKRRAS